MDNAIQSIMQGEHFIKAQGYEVMDNILYQDNKFTILLATNGRVSSSCNTKHIHCQYFAIKDLVDCGELSIEHCSTDKMWADVLIKPLSGNPYRVMHREIMNVDVDYNNVKNASQLTPYFFPRIAPMRN